MCLHLNTGSSTKRRKSFFLKKKERKQERKKMVLMNNADRWFQFRNMVISKKLLGRAYLISNECWYWSEAQRRTSEKYISILAPKRGKAAKVCGRALKRSTSGIFFSGSSSVRCHHWNQTVAQVSHKILFNPGTAYLFGVLQFWKDCHKCFLVFETSMWGRQAVVCDHSYFYVNYC